MLIAILMLYFNERSDKLLSPAQLDRRGTWRRQCRWPRGAQGARPRPIHTFNLLALAADRPVGRNSPFNASDCCGPSSIQWWAFLLLFIGFAIKVPVVPLHTWLPDAHVEAPTPISMILAGVLLEDGRLRHPPHLLSDLPRGRLRPGVGRVRPRRGQHGLRRLRRHGPDRLQAAGRLQLGEPHGLRGARHRRLDVAGGRIRPRPITGRWA